MRFNKHSIQQVTFRQVRLYPRSLTRKTISKEHISPELSTGHVELGLLFLQLAQVVILLIICCAKNGLQTMTKTVP